MAVSTPTAVTVTTSATALVARNEFRRSVTFTVPSGGATVYIGGSDVTTSTGTPLAAGNSFTVNQSHQGDASPLMAWYGIVAASTQDVRILVVEG